ncbi:LysR family transcriptional regulator [Microbacterium pseudoresistens]|uniref:DNA-binding transcriptional LysR family regulator n=1 Tax=Microbacterium pseudoresistens TaxID=640634 RepID=A0A7Y9JMK3_9MICO|nr:LysR substrate-binding domain-containing protein [Microbacterium pseudoresistens]NYD54460.1 DNA-binding transcriptional LysR family regulator [Microbacterium pseudoresistens]
MNDSLEVAGDNLTADLTLREFSYVLEVAERRSFTNAALEMHLSQSALSRAINETERRLGTRLFTRTTRAVDLTPEGVEFVRLAKRLLATHRRTLNEFALFRQGLSGSVRVAALPSVAAILLPPLVARLQSERPGIALSVDDTLAHVAIDRLLAGEVDYALTTDDWLPEGVTFTPLTSDRFRVVFREDHPFHERSEVTWQEFADQPVAMFGASSSIRTRTDRVLTDLGLSISTTIEAQNIAVVAGLVAAGLGVAAAPEFVIPLMKFADLESATLTEPLAERPLGLVSVPDRATSPAAREFARILREVVSRPVHDESPPAARIRLDG